MPFDVAPDERHRQRAVRRCSRVAAAGGGAVVAGCASRCSRCAASRVEGDVDAQQRRDPARQCRAAAGRQLLHVDLARARARLRVGALGAPGGRAPRVWPESPAVQLEEHRAGRAVGRRRRRRQAGQQLRRGVRGQRRRCRGRGAAALRGPGRAARRRCWRCTARSQPLFAAARAARVERCTLSGRGSLAARARHRRGDRARPRQRRRGARRARSASCARVPPGDARATQRPLRVRRPAPHRRLCGAPEGRHHDRRRRRKPQARNHRNEDTWPRNTRTWSSASTSAPPR